MKKNHYLCLLSAIFFCIFFVEIHAQETYSKISIKPVTQELMNTLVDLGMTIDHPEFQADGAIAFYVTQRDLQLLDQKAIDFTVEIENYAQFYEQQTLSDIPNLASMQRNDNVAQGFDLGSMGGFYTWDEVAGKLDEMKQDYPNLITAKTSIGTSIEGREIWMAKISDNPNMNEEEPVAYFDGLHHAREPLSMATTINYMFWLLENYGVDPRVTWLVDNRELYFVPVVNPDGYEYNRETDPEGGGLWRKNRNPNDGNCTGVDLNRNYAFGYAANNNCSSPDPCSGVYRGEGPFSEPETSAVRDFLGVIGPNTAFSTHSTAGSYLMPYGFDASPPAFDIYSEWASVFLSENDYPYGVTFQMLGYTSCGTTRDYMFSEDIFGWTPEIDGQGFWPPQSTIFDLVGENVYPMFYQSWISGAFVDIQSHRLLGDVLAGESFAVEVEVKNVGVGAMAENVTVVMESATLGVTVSDPYTYGAVPIRSRASNENDPFIVTIAPDFDESLILLKMSTYQDGILNDTLEIPVYAGEKEVFFFDDASAGAGQWTASGNGIEWGQVTDDAYSGTSCFGDSDGGNGVNNTLNYFELNQTFDFKGAITPAVTFMAKYSIENGDFVNFEISVDDGSNWQALKSFTASEPWSHHFVNLSNYAEQSSVKFRFLMDTDGFIPGDGFYFDDFGVANYNEEFLGTTSLPGDSFRLYPNPFQNKITVGFTGVNGDSISEVILYDLHGRVLRNMRNDGVETLVVQQLEGLTNGIYFIQLKSVNGKEAVRKIIKI